MSSSKSPSASRARNSSLSRYSAISQSTRLRELVGAGEIVDGEDRGHAAIVERTDQVGADEAGGAGDDGVHGMSFVFFAVREVAVSAPGYSSRSIRPTSVATTGTRGATAQRSS